MSKFIRLDFDRNFRGIEHISSMTGDGEHLENGISCYEIDKYTIFDAIESLHQYWCEEVGECDFTNFQITIFEGIRVFNGNQKAYGANGEDLAECNNNETIVKLDGELFNKVYEYFIMNENYKDGFTDEDDDPWMDDEELENKINEMFKLYV